MDGQIAFLTVIARAVVIISSSRVVGCVRLSVLKSYKKKTNRVELHDTV